jgi:hypothetical protein
MGEYYNNGYTAEIFTLDFLNINHTILNFPMREQSIASVFLLFLLLVLPTAAGVAKKDKGKIFGMQSQLFTSLCKP